MTESQPEIYTLFCVVLGNDSPFPIKIPKDETVGILKTMIQEKKKNGLKDIDADDLKLYLVELADDEEMESNATLIMSKGPSPLRATCELSDIFDGTPKKKTIHIIVQPPISESVPATTPPNYPSSSPNLNNTTPPNQFAHVPEPLTPKRSEALAKAIEKFANNLRKLFENFLVNEVQLPTWQPSLGTQAVRDHIAGLKIPLTTSLSESPSLLLHNIGQPSHDAQFAGRVDKLFIAGSGLRFLCNTSGSGKTRLLLEGLWRNWGFYFTARTQPEKIGSSDLETVLNELKLKPLPNIHYKSVLQDNRAVADHRSFLILYVRLFVFHIFLECASAMPGGITEDHKGRWLLFQLAPQTFIPDADIFRAFAQLAGRLDTETLKEYIQVEIIGIKELLAPQPPTLFCVLDEAQVPTNMFLDCFMSDTKPAKPRPILRQIILTWNAQFPNLIVSGTGLSMRDLEIALGSIVAKPHTNVRPPTMTDIGGFDNEIDQRAYLEQYLPPGYLDAPWGKEVLSRVGYWLRGRHRFTATYISCLLQAGIESPHRVLNNFVHTMTGFWPSDWEDDTLLTVKLAIFSGFDFSSLLESSKKRPGLLTTMASFVFEYTFTGKIRGVGGPEGDAMVEFGVSRFRKSSGDDDRVAETDEPLAILGFVTFLQDQGHNLERYLREALNVSNAIARGFAFEPFGAYILARAFATPRPLSKIFEFVEKSELQDELAELVTLERIGDTFRVTPLNLTSDIRSNHVLGYSPSTIAGTLKWLHDPRGSAFCFPANAVGPDLICVLRLTRDNTVLRVCVQFKHTKGLGPKETENAIRTTDPFAFLSQVKAGQLTISDPPMQADIVEAIRNLGGKGTTKAGECGVLRVLVSHPSPPDDDTLDRAAEDRHGHPVVTITVDDIELPNSDLHQSILGLANLSLGRTAQKRKNPNGIDGTKRKKQKTIAEVER